MKTKQINTLQFDHQFPYLSQFVLKQTAQKTNKFFI